jgi:hypothetical protein
MRSLALPRHLADRQPEPQGRGVVFTEGKEDKPWTAITGRGCGLQRLFIAW